MTGENFPQTNKEEKRREKGSESRTWNGCLILIELRSHFSPAHDLMCQQHSAHLWILVLAFINNRLLGEKKKAQRELGVSETRQTQSSNPASRCSEASSRLIGCFRLGRLRFQYVIITKIIIIIHFVILFYADLLIPKKFTLT